MAEVKHSFTRKRMMGQRQRKEDANQTDQKQTSKTSFRSLLIKVMGQQKATGGGSPPRRYGGNSSNGSGKPKKLAIITSSKGQNNTSAPRTIQRLTAKNRERADTNVIMDILKTFTAPAKRDEAQTKYSDTDSISSGGFNASDTGKQLHDADDTDSTYFRLNAAAKSGPFFRNSLSPRSMGENGVDNKITKTPFTNDAKIYRRKARQNSKARGENYHQPGAKDLYQDAKEDNAQDIALQKLKSHRITGGPSKVDTFEDRNGLAIATKNTQDSLERKREDLIKGRRRREIGLQKLRSAFTGRHTPESVDGSRPDRDEFQTEMFTYDKTEKPNKLLNRPATLTAAAHSERNEKLKMNEAGNKICKNSYIRRRPHTPTTTAAAAAEGCIYAKLKRPSSVDPEMHEQGRRAKNLTVFRRAATTTNPVLHNSSKDRYGLKRVTWFESGKSYPRTCEDRNKLSYGDVKQGDRSRSVSTEHGTHKITHGDAKADQFNISPRHATLQRAASVTAINKKTTENFSLPRRQPPNVRHTIHQQQTQLQQELQGRTKQHYQSQSISSAHLIDGKKATLNRSHRTHTIFKPINIYGETPHKELYPKHEAKPKKGEYLLSQGQTALSPACATSPNSSRAQLVSSLSHKSLVKTNPGPVAPLLGHALSSSPRHERQNSPILSPPDFDHRQTFHKKDCEQRVKQKAQKIPDCERKTCVTPTPKLKRRNDIFISASTRDITPVDKEDRVPFPSPTCMRTRTIPVDGPGFRKDISGDCKKCSRERGFDKTGDKLTLSPYKKSLRSKSSIETVKSCDKMDKGKPKKTIKSKIFSDNKCNRMRSGKRCQFTVPFKTHKNQWESRESSRITKFHSARKIGNTQTTSPTSTLTSDQSASLCGWKCSATKSDSITLGEPKPLHISSFGLRTFAANVMAVDVDELEDSVGFVQIRDNYQVGDSDFVIRDPVLSCENHHDNLIESGVSMPISRPASFNGMDAKRSLICKSDSSIDVENQRDKRTLEQHRKHIQDVGVNTSLQRLGDDFAQAHREEKKLCASREPIVELGLRSEQCRYEVSPQVQFSCPVPFGHFDSSRAITQGKYITNTAFGRTKEDIHVERTLCRLIESSNRAAMRVLSLRESLRELKHVSVALTDDPSQELAEDGEGKRSNERRSTYCDYLMLVAFMALQLLAQFVFVNK